MSNGTTNATMQGNIIDGALKFARDFGIFALICVAFIWWGQEDKKKMQEQIDDNAQFVRNEFRGTLDKSSRVIEANTIALNALVQNQKLTTQELSTIRSKLDDMPAASPKSTERQH